MPAIENYVLCRYKLANETKIGMVLDPDAGVVGDLTSRGVKRMEQLANISSKELLQRLASLSKIHLPQYKDPYWYTNLLTPVGPNQPVWAAGVTYINSVLARVEESGRNDYARVYHATRPEEFPKALRGAEVVGPDGMIGIREDSA